MIINASCSKIKDGRVSGFQHETRVVENSIKNKQTGIMTTLQNMTSWQEVQGREASLILPFECMMSKLP